MAIKKMTLIAISSLLLAPANAQAFEGAFSDDPASISDGPLGYEAEILKDTTYIKPSNLKQTYTLKAGTKVKVVEKIDYRGYQMIRLYGNKLIKANNENIDLQQPYPHPKQYDLFIVPKKVKANISKVNEENADYLGYKFFAEKEAKNEYYKRYDYKLKQYVDVLFRGGLRPLAGPSHKYTDYQGWIKLGKPEPAEDKPVEPCDSKALPKVNLLNKTVKYRLMNKSTQYTGGIKKGQSESQVIDKYINSTCGYLNTFAGEAQQFGDIGVIFKKGKVSSNIIIPREMITMHAVKQVYGEPSYTNQTKKVPNEFITTYNKKKFKVIIAYNYNGGQVKYVRKVMK